ncbi:MAG: hypothetical protein ACI4BB_07410 [Coprococcus sp.]
MKGQSRIMALILLVGLLVMTGCEKRYTGSETDTTEKEETEIELETESETNPATVLESVETEKVTETNAQELKDFESSLGYHILYDDALFEYNRSRDYDEIVLKGQTFSSKPPVFFAAMKIENDDVQNVISEIFTESAQQTTIGRDGYEALCQPTVESGDDGKNKTYHNQYLVHLANGDALLFEIQWNEEEGGNVNGRKLAAMRDSIVIDQPVQGLRAETGVSEETEKPSESQMESDQTESEQK